MDVWDKTVRALQATVEPYDFKHWIRPIRLESVDEASGEIVLTVPDDSHGRWLEDHFLSAIEETLSDVAMVPYRVQFRPQPEEVAAPWGGRTRRGASVPPELVDRYRFDAFVGGPNSQFALTASQSVSDCPGTRYNPLFLYGGVGLGKTHLLHAIGHAVLRADPSKRVVYVTSETFLNDLISAIRNGCMDLFRARYRDRCDVLLVDDIQFLAGKERTQEEFFHLFNTLHASHKQIVLTSDQVPQSIPDLEERLRSRLQWGLVADIKPPGFETRVAILKGKADADDLELDDPVAMLLAEHITGNVRELEGALMRLGANSRVFGRPISLHMAEDVLRDLAGARLRRISPERIIAEVSESFHVAISDLKGPRRHRHVILPRQVAMVLIRELTDASLPIIGQLFGGRDHTTVLNALRRIESLGKADPALLHRLEALRRRLEG